MTPETVAVIVLTCSRLSVPMMVPIGVSFPTSKTDTCLGADSVSEAVSIVCGVIAWRMKKNARSSIAPARKAVNGRSMPNRLMG